MTMTHHSEPAEAVARALREHFGTSSTTTFTAREAGRQAASVALRHLSVSPAPAAGGLEAVREEVGWLVELKGPTPSWAIVNPNDYDEHWTADSTAAIRFARKTDAEAFIAWHGWTEAFPSEHIWDSGRAALASPAATSAETQGGDGVREGAFNAHVASTLGWADFAKLHTQISGAEYKRAFLAGFQSGCLTDAEKKEQAERCSCRGADDYCVCQNSPDTHTTRQRNGG